MLLTLSLAEAYLSAHLESKLWVGSAHQGHHQAKDSASALCVANAACMMLFV